MTADDIVRIAVTVVCVQVACDLLANYFVYQKEPYLRLVKNLERAQTKYDKLVKESEGKTGKQQDKVKKRLQVAKDDLGEAKSEVAKKHSAPGILQSFLFVFLFQILGAEYSGKVVGVLPFTPWKLLRRISMRGLDFGDELGGALFQKSVGVDTVHQACSFTVIYVLCNVGVKFFVHKLVGESPPPGADGGLYAVMESPKVARGLRQLGIDPDELKMD